MARRESFRDDVIRNVSSGFKNSPSFIFQATFKFAKDVIRNVDNGMERFLEKINGQKEKAKPIPTTPPVGGGSGSNPQKDSFFKSPERVLTPKEDFNTKEYKDALRYFKKRDLEDRERYGDERDR